MPETTIEMWQTTQLDHAIAERLFGWRWIAFRGMPTNDHPLYDDPVCRGGPGIRVRRFMSPEALKSEQWQQYWAEHEGAPATGDEPLAYCYCSSCGPAMVPHFSGHEDAAKQMERALDKRGLWTAYENALGGPKKARRASCKRRCIAALEVLQIVETKEP